MPLARIRAAGFAAIVTLAVSVGVVVAPPADARGIRVGPLSRHTVSGRPTGIDVSIYQHPHHRPIRWGTVARHHRFVFIEATGGAAGRRSPWYQRDAAAAHRAGLAVGAYSFANMRRPVRATAQADARRFARVVGRQRHRGTLPPVLDVELNPHHLGAGQIVRWVRAWAATVHRRTGRRPIVYTYPYFWDRTVHGSRALSHSFSLWIAAYTMGHGSHPLMPRGWRHWTLWQAAGGNGRAAGVPGECDLDVFNGSILELNRLALRGHARHGARHHRTRHHRHAAHHRHGRHRHHARHHRRRHHHVLVHTAVAPSARPASVPAGATSHPTSAINAVFTAITDDVAAGSPSPGGLYDLLTSATQAGASSGPSH